MGIVNEMGHLALNICARLAGLARKEGRPDGSKIEGYSARNFELQVALLTHVLLVSCTLQK
jgi:hypothetical protein